VSEASLRNGTLTGLHLGKKLSSVRNTRNVTKRDLLWNDAVPSIEVDPETYVVKADGRELRCDPALTLPMAQRYFLF
jgi:urease subunit alpha